MRRYFEAFHNMALENICVGRLTNEEKSNNIRYADDTVVFADSPECLPGLMIRVDAGLEFRVSLNIKITQPSQLINNIQQIEIVTNYKYFGSTIIEKLDHSRLLKCYVSLYSYIVLSTKTQMKMCFIIICEIEMKY